MKFITKTKQGGFTLVELVVVIVILGILAAFAIPKFIDLSVTARQGVLDATEGNVRAAANLAYAQAVAEGKASSAASTITVSGTSVSLDYGYPDLAGMGNMISLSGVTYDNSTGVFTVDGKSNCTLAYTAATSTALPTYTQTDTCT